MCKQFESIEELCQQIVADKNYTGAESSTLNRYPVRFVLLESFEDLTAFIQECLNRSIYVVRIDKWLSTPERLMTYTQLSGRYTEYVSNEPARDYVLVPFFEMVRFTASGKDSGEFDTLLRTVRLIQAKAEAQEKYQRIYIPIVGMQELISPHRYDPHIHIWELHSKNRDPHHRVIFTPGTLFGLAVRPEDFTHCENISQWLKLSASTHNVNKDIICSSRILFESARHMRPDNVFEYVACSNVYDFLTKGLQLDLGNIIPSSEEMPYWEKLAAKIDIHNFSFYAYVEELFPLLCTEGPLGFIRTWTELRDDFSRWLICTYYLSKNGDRTYLGRVLRQCEARQTSELYSQLATLIFEEAPSDDFLQQRRTAMQEMARQGGRMQSSAEERLASRLDAMIAEPSCDMGQVLKYMTSCTDSEKARLVQWLGQGQIIRENVLDVYPELYNYTDPAAFQLTGAASWVNDYMIEYRLSKIANTPSPQLLEYLKEKNSSPIRFSAWKNEFKTVKTILHNRKDIDIYYWIDGLGVDWIPYVKRCIEQQNREGIYLNEIYVATAALPTTTSINKPKLQELTSEELHKIGDVDEYAHTFKQYPAYICEEFSLIDKAIKGVLDQYSDKTIAIVSDHGISYMAQHGKGKNLANLGVDQGGRYAKVQPGYVNDEAYVFTDDEQTICSLTHDSLTTKTPAGKGAHGGATPEEVLVPIFIISNKKNTYSYSAKLLTRELSASSPYALYEIRGELKGEVPVVYYGKTEYPLSPTRGNIYTSAHLPLNSAHRKLKLQIGEYTLTDSIDVHTGVEENDLFDL